jgi:hypothetical protein
MTPEQKMNRVTWLLSHVIFSLIAVCAVRGGYQFYLEWMPERIDISQLSEEGKATLAQMLVEDGFNVPNPKGSK